MSEKRPTLGEKRVRVTFNPAKDDYVAEIKQKAAELLDLIDGAAEDPKFNQEEFREFNRLKALAMTAVEEAAMWGVKMATY